MPSDNEHLPRPVNSADTNAEATAASPHIQIDSIGKFYKNRRRRMRKRNDDNPEAFGDVIKVMENIDLEIDKGEMVCILGPSGCGKSTLLRMIAGFDFPSTGVIRVSGQPVTGPRADSIFVFQHNGLLPWMTVYQNVGLGIRNMPESEEKHETISEYIEMVELEGFEHHYPHQLSGGMQRRAEIARAMVVNPEILIMDEPFSGLDFLTHMKLREEIVTMHGFIRKTTLIVTHDIDDALVMGDHVVIFGGRPAELVLNQKMEFPRPRDFVKIPELNEMRSKIYMMMGVHYAV